MDEQRCVACGEICDDGFALGRLCYFCIESVVVKSVKGENNELKMDVNMVFHLTKKLNQESSREDLEYDGSEKKAFKDGLYFAEKLIVDEYNKFMVNDESIARIPTSSIVGHEALKVIRMQQKEIDRLKEEIENIQAENEFQLNTRDE